MGGPNCGPSAGASWRRAEAKVGVGDDDDDYDAKVGGLNEARVHGMLA